jgi:hypothetical protein
MSRYIEGENRNQLTLEPLCFDVRTATSTAYVLHEKLNVNVTEILS